MDHPRIPRRLPAVAALAVLTVALVGGGTPRADTPRLDTPRLVANTNADCNAVQAKGFARCFAVVRTPAPGTMTPALAAPPP
jgi:hypothetical protein